jgi:hypothetical protein
LNVGCCAVSPIDMAAASAAAPATGFQTFMVSAYCNGGSNWGLRLDSDRPPYFDRASAWLIAGSSAEAIRL